MPGREGRREAALSRGTAAWPHAVHRAATAEMSRPAVPPGPAPRGLQQACASVGGPMASRGGSPPRPAGHIPRAPQGLRSTCVHANEKPPQDQQFEEPRGETEPHQEGSQEGQQVVEQEGSFPATAEGGSHLPQAQRWSGTPLSGGCPHGPALLALEEAHRRLPSGGGGSSASPEFPAGGIPAWGWDRGLHHP